jgi:hypothetical protein
MAISQNALFMSVKMMAPLPENRTRPDRFSSHRDIKKQTTVMNNGTAS